VLSDRKPAPGAPRTDLESAIEGALREHDGIWLVRRPESAPTPAASGEQWSVLDSVPAQPMEEWTGYARANASYAERIVEMSSPDAMIWIHGHRWLLVAPALRGYGHRGPIGLVLDVPFPARARLEAMPWYADVMAALCQLDLIGFRSQACADNFEACRVRTGPQPRITVFPDDSASTDRTDAAERVTSFLRLLGAAAPRPPA
jgi:trehalose-6-phosphate synthase